MRPADGYVRPEPTLWEASEPKPLPTYVEPCLPASANPTHYDESPTQLRIDLERKALAYISDRMAHIERLEDELDQFGQPVDTNNERISRVWSGVFHSDAKGQRLIKFVDSHGPNQLQHMMETGVFDQGTNGGFVQRHLRQLGSGTTRIFMVHESMPNLEALYQHPDNVAQVDEIFAHKREQMASRIAQEKQNLHDYKQAVRKDLAELDKRMNKLLS